MPLVVDRLTKTQIICGLERFRKSNGQRVGDHSPRTYLISAEKAHEIILQIKTAERRGHFKVKFTGTPGGKFNTSTVTHMRAECDAAEAFLREQGEWL